MVSGSLGEKNGVTSVILLPRKTVISLAAMISLQGTIPCFITMTLTPLNRILTLITKLTLPRLRKLYAIISSNKLFYSILFNIISKFFGLQHDRRDTEFY